MVRDDEVLDEADLVREVDGLVRQYCVVVRMSSYVSAFFYIILVTNYRHNFRFVVLHIHSSCA